MPFHIIRNDITKVQADAIVNTANPEPVYASGTDNAIYQAAGARKLLAERKKIGRIGQGEVAVTKAFRLPARYIIHTVGPAWIDGQHGEYETLASCYRKSLLIARQLGCQSIAFPLISTGVYGFPKDKALEIALYEFSSFLHSEEETEMDITLVVFDRKAFELSAGLVAGVSQFIDENYVESRREQEYGGSPQQYSRRLIEERRRQNISFREDAFRDNSPEEALTESFVRDEAAFGDRIPGTGKPGKPADRKSEAGITGKPADRTAAAGKTGTTADRTAAAGKSGTTADRKQEAGKRGKSSAAAPSPEPASPQRSLQDLMAQVGESFQERLLRLIDERNLKDSTVYKRANIDRKLFSKIRCNPGYVPKKQTAVALGLALELNMDEMTDLLRRAGLALSPGSKADLIIRYCVENGIYDPIEVDLILFKYGQKTLSNG